MKKSKIIVPALGILAFSTAAAVTGTVAWFTANRLVTVNATAITAYNPEAGLKVTLSGHKGCVAGASSVGTGDTAASVTHNQLRDASVDLENTKVWRSILNDDGSAVSSYGDVTAAATEGTAAGSYTGEGTTYYYWCSIYTAKFELVQQSTSEVYNLKYDNTKLVATNTGSLAIAPALRIGIVLSDGSFKVITPFKAAGANSYVNSATTATGSYAGCLGSDKSGNFAMGTLTGSGYVEATIYTWFEGTDATCINANVNIAQSVSVGLKFTISQ